MRVAFEFALYDPEDNETICEIECDLTPEEKETPRTFNDGGSPGWPATCEILKVEVAGVEVKDWERMFTDADLKKIEEAAFQKAADDEEYAKEQLAESQAELRYEEDL